MNLFVIKAAATIVLLLDSSEVNLNLALSYVSAR